MTDIPTPRPLTGRTVLGIALGAFGIIIAVNLLLAVMAVRTFSGLVVPNSYVASQTFDRDRAAQIGLGWTLALSYADGALHLDLTDRTGAAARPARLALSIGRPAGRPQAVSAALVETNRGYAVPLALAPGDWRVEVDAATADGTRFRQRRNLLVTAP